MAYVRIQKNNSNYGKIGQLDWFFKDASTDASTTASTGGEPLVWNPDQLKWERPPTVCSCGRAIPPGMTECPVCHPQTTKSTQLSPEVPPSPGPGQVLPGVQQIPVGKKKQKLVFFGIGLILLLLLIKRREKR